MNVKTRELEVIWPLHRGHYLSLPDPGTLDPGADAVSVPLVAMTGRELAARALLAGPDGSPPRVSDLLEVSRGTIDRMADAECSPALRDRELLEEARTCLAETASRGSSVEEREAAVAWLEHVARAEHQVAGVQALRRRPPGPRPGASSRSRRTGGAHHNGNGRATATTARPAPEAPPPLPQVEALRRQQQRILHRSALVDYVLKAETRGGAPLTLGDALAELLADITEAARTIGTLLQSPPQS